MKCLSTPLAPLWGFWVELKKTIFKNMAVPKKRRSKSKKRLKKQCWRKKAETQAKIAYSLYRSVTKEKSVSTVSE